MSDNSKPAWGFPEIIFVYLGILLLGIVFSLLGEQMQALFFRLGIPNDILSLFTAGFVLQFISTVVLVLIFTMGINRASFKDIGIKSVSGKQYLKYGLGGGLLLILVIIILGLPINYLKPDIEPQLYEDMLRSVTSSAGFIGLFIMGAVLAPLSEELFYRGMIYPVFRRYLGPVWGAVMAGAIFGLVHWDLWRAIPLAAGGIILCYLYEKTGSIFVTTLAHGTWNGIMSIVIYTSIIAL